SCASWPLTSLCSLSLHDALPIYAGSIDFYYWSRLKRYYLEGGLLAAPVVATLDNVTDEILDYSGNPLMLGIGSRRGMVIGHVQRSEEHTSELQSRENLVCRLLLV